MTLKEKCKLVRERVPVVEVLSFFGLDPARREGRRLFYLCPFHAERDPSFVTKSGESSGHCFGCGRSYSSIDVFMHLSGISSLGEAVQEMAARFGVDLETSRPAPRRPKAERKSALEELAEAEVRYVGKTPSRGGWLQAVRHGFSHTEARALARLLPEGPVWLDRLGRFVSRMELPVGGRWIATGYALRLPNGEKRDLPGSTKGLVILRPWDLTRVRSLVLTEGVRDLLALYLRAGEHRRERTVYVLHPGSLTRRQEDALIRLLARLPASVRVFCAYDRDSVGERYYLRIREALTEEGLSNRIEYFPPPEPCKDWFQYYHPSHQPVQPTPSSPPGRERAHAPAPGC